MGLRVKTMRSKLDIFKKLIKEYTGGNENGIDFTEFAKRYITANADQPVRYHLPVRVQKAWFKMKYPEGRLSYKVVESSPERILVKCTVYADKEGTILAESYGLKDMAVEDDFSAGIPPLLWAETSAAGYALSDAGFGLLFDCMGDAWDEYFKEKKEAESKANAKADPTIEAAKAVLAAENLAKTSKTKRGKTESVAAEPRTTPQMPAAPAPKPKTTGKAADDGIVPVPDDISPFMVEPEPDTVAEPIAVPNPAPAVEPAAPAPAKAVLTKDETKAAPTNAVPDTEDGLRVISLPVIAATEAMAHKMPLSRGLTLGEMEDAGVAFIIGKRFDTLSDYDKRAIYTVALQRETVKNILKKKYETKIA